MKSGFVAVVGRPNVGKSTLVNAAVGTKVAITSPRPQTTRNTIRGVVHGEERQLVLVDSPGLHKPKNALGERLNRLVYGTLAESDAALFVIDATSPIGPGDRLIAERLRESGIQTVVAVNKTDLGDKDAVISQLGHAGEWDFAAYVPVSALTGENVDLVVEELASLMPEGPAYFPTEMVTDQPEQTVIGELVREKYLARLREELPHSLTVSVEDIEERPNGTTYISARVIVERDSQKGIVIGKGGEMLKTVGAEARAEIEALLGTSVFLELRVKVEKGWQDKPQLLDRLGF
ncbi:MAG: GTPase Era [Acidimicrobiia bacterium]|nr:GTPase Era [Acidimicrobiia bacterium]NNL98197.1 GTPase Era [Acidimicrobiia bacterium]